MHSLPEVNKALLFQCILIFAGAVIVLSVFYPSIGVRDDAYEYIVGAYSLRKGEGFLGAAGQPLNVWPIGYFALLSVFHNPIQAAQVINYSAFALAVMLVFFLARQAGWNRHLALCVCVIMGFGFLRSIAAVVKPDILTYALFLLGVVFYGYGNRASWLAYLIWDLLILFKIIASVFTPLGLAVSWYFYRPQKNAHRRISIVALLGWATCVLIVIAINIDSAQEVYPVYFSGKPHTVDFIQGCGSFVWSVARQFLSFWYGSIRHPAVMAPFLLCLLLGLWAFSILRRVTNKKFLALGTLIIVSATFLRFLIPFPTDVRITGYGVILIVLGLKPLEPIQSKNVRWPYVFHRWTAYALVAILLAIYNVTTVNALGGGDPRYKAAVMQLNKPSHGKIFSNSWYLMDVHTGVRTTPSHSFPNEKDALFMWFQMPNFDPIDRPILKTEAPSNTWRLVQQVQGLSLWQSQSIK